MSGRIEARFEALAEERRAGLVTFLCAGDPDAATFDRLLAGLPAAGADLLEIGMPFTDPMADGPSIQAGKPEGARRRHHPAPRARDGAALPRARRR